MGRIKEVLAELDNGAECVITQWGLTFGENALEGSYHITVNDIEQTMNVLKYLRETRPFETLEQITREVTGSHPHIEFPDLATLPEAPIVAPGKGKK